MRTRGHTQAQCDQKNFFQIANERCQNRQKIANIFRKLFEIAINLGQNRHLNPAFFVFYCIFITKFSRKLKKSFLFFQKKVNKFFFASIGKPHSTLISIIYSTKASLTKKGGKVKSDQKINKSKPKISSKTLKLFSLCSKHLNFYSKKSKSPKIAIILA